MKRLLGLAALLAGCHSGPAFSPHEIDELSRSCQEQIASGRFDARRYRSIGFEPETKPAGTPVVMYGATWCGVCKLAAQYMKQRGIAFVEKDIDEDEANEAARRSVLSAAGLRPTTSLPVIDIRGTVTVGFAACAIEQAWAQP